MAKKKKTHIRLNQAYFQKKDPIYESMWINKYISKFMLQGKKFLTQKYAYAAFSKVKFAAKYSPSDYLLHKIYKFRPLFTYVNKRMGRKFNPVPLLVKPGRQSSMSLTAIVRYTKSIVHRDFDEKIKLSLSDLFTTTRNYMTRKLSDDVKYLSDARVFFYMRWV